jgi:hypothetical protein
MHERARAEDLDVLGSCAGSSGVVAAGWDQPFDGAEEIASTKSPILSSGRFRAMSA